MMRKRKTVVAKRVTPKVMTGIPKTFGILNDPLGNQIESKLMEKEENEQRKCDRFWGQDKDLQDRSAERRSMAAEDASSLSYEKWLETVEIHKMWDEEFQRNLWFENRSQAKYREIERREYLKFVNSSLSSDEVINFVWGSTSRNPTSDGSQSQQGLVFSDLSAIGKEVALSLPSAVGALHMSIHLDGLQQSRAIVDEASTAFKQTLRRINTQSADDGDAAQPFKTNALAAEIIKTTKQKNTSDVGLNNIEEASVSQAKPNPIVESLPEPVPAIDGHPLHKWDQELMLQLAFMTLDQGGKGRLTVEEVASVAFESTVHALLSFTVFWAPIKKRNWSLFQAMQSGGREGISMQDWMSCAQGLSLEVGVPLRHIRTYEEHEEICKPAPTALRQPPHICSASFGSGLLFRGSNSMASRGVGAANVFSGLPEREHRVSRQLSEGDCVWALHWGGVLWLPAVVKAVHVTPTKMHSTMTNAHNGTVTYNSYSYDLWYPLSQKELNKARSAMTARQLLTLPSQVQQKRQMQEQLVRLSIGSAVAHGAEADLSRSLPPKSTGDERRVCSYAFDLVDSGGEGMVQLPRLVQCMQSLEFSRIVATSLALSTIFHGGSYALSHGVEDVSGKATRAGPLPGATTDLPSLLPVFIDTFSAPDDEELEKRGKEEQPDGSLNTATKEPDWISKLDFLEFCQAVLDVKRYSVSTTQ